MRKTIPKMVTAFLCLVIITLTTGCNFSFDQERDLQLGKMEEQIKTLRLDNARLKKQIVKSEIIETSTKINLLS